MSKLIYTSYYTLLDTDPKIYHILYDLSVFTVANLMINHKNQTNNIRRNQKIAKIANRVLVRKIFEGDFFKEYIPPPPKLRRQTHSNCNSCSAVRTDYGPNSCWNCGFYL